MSEDELWRPISGFEYEVSNQGRIRNRDGHIMAPGVIARGYHNANLWRNQKGNTRLIHRLVVEAFIGPIPPGCMVNHKNFNTSDNRVSNLEICTRKQNTDHAKAGGRFISGNAHWTRKRAPTGSAHPCSKLSDDQVREIKRRLAAGEQGKLLASEFGMSKATLSRIKNGASWGHVEAA